MAGLIILVASLAFAFTFPMIIIAAIARTNGWAELAKKYRADREPDGLRMNWLYVKVGWADYNGCMTIVISPAGLYMRVMKILAWGHPPILIPWSELHVKSVKENWLGRDVTIEVGEPSITKIKLPLKVLEAAAEHWQTSTNATTDDADAQTKQAAEVFAFEEE